MLEYDLKCLYDWNMKNDAKKELFFKLNFFPEKC